LDDKRDQLAGLLSDRPACASIVEAVLAVWPDHADFLLKSFRARPPAVLDASEAGAAASLRLIGPNLARFSEDYCWMCGEVREEELFFFREGRYRLSTFAEANEKVYSDHAFMSRYMNALLVSQTLWFNHSSILEMYLNRVIGGMESPFDYLEIGPGHGLMIHFAAQTPSCRSLEAWDVSPTSLAETRAALDKLTVAKPVTLTRTDILQAETPPGRYDLIVISEVLEHLERPDVALDFLRRVISDTGRLFANVPINSPAPDHIYLLRHPDEVRALVEKAGFRIEAAELFATQGVRLDRAITNQVSISAGILASPA
jgi:SAM-dependent methyltransferase